MRAPYSSSGGYSLDGTVNIVPIVNINNSNGTNGSPGAAGISNAKFNSLPNISISTANSGANGSANFFTVAESGNYTFEVLISGTVSKTEDLNFTAEIVSGPEMRITPIAPVPAGVAHAMMV